MTDRDAETPELDLLEDALRKTMLSHSGAELDAALAELGWAEMLADVAQQQEEIAQDTRGWLYGYLLLAYSPLEDAELDRYIAFAQSDAGRSLNTALFEGFGTAYEDVSYALGRAVALNMVAEEL